MLVGGSEPLNDPEFFVNALIWWSLLQHAFGVLPEAIHVCYGDGETPTTAELLERCDNELSRQQIGQLLAKYPPERMPISGSICCEDMNEGIAGLARANVDEAFLITEMHGDVVTEESSSGPMKEASALCGSDGVLSSSQMQDALRGNRVGKVLAFMTNCYALHFLDIPEEVPNLAVFTSNGGTGKAEVGFVRSFYSWSTVVKAIFTHPCQADMDGDGAISLQEMQQEILSSSSDFVHQFCFPLSGVCRDIRPGF